MYDYLDKRAKTVIRLCLAAAIVVLGILALWHIVAANEQAAKEELVEQQIDKSAELDLLHWTIMQAISAYDEKFYESDIILELVVSPKGEYYYRAKLGETFGEHLQELVENYNANPLAPDQINYEEARYGLTDGISYAFDISEKSDLQLFLNWCGQCSLVYRYDTTLNDGTFYAAGTPVAIESITNYEYIAFRDVGIPMETGVISNYESVEYGNPTDFYAYKFPWE